MARKPLPKPPTIVAYRPNGVEYQRVTSWDVEVTANMMRGAIRNDRGWTPTFRVLSGEGQDITHVYRV
jgi:hypothetical protein